MPSAIELLDIIGRGGVLAGCVVLIWALVAEKLVPKGRLDQERRDWERHLEQVRERYDQARVERMQDKEYAREHMEDAMAKVDRLLDAVGRVEDGIDGLAAEARRR